MCTLSSLLDHRPSGSSVSICRYTFPRGLSPVRSHYHMQIPAVRMCTFWNGIHTNIRGHFAKSRNTNNNCQCHSLFSSNMPNPTLLFRSHALCFLSSQSFPPPHPFLFPPPYFLSPHKWGQWHKFLPSFLPSLSLPPPHFPSPPSVKVRILPSCIPHHCTTSRLCADVPLWYSTARWRRRNNRRSHACTYAFAQENKHTCEWTRARRIANLTVCVFVKLKRRKSKLGKSKSVHY